MLYPMNALVEDQMVRLRRALDSARGAGLVMPHRHRGDRFYFGRYTGRTPVPGTRAQRLRCRVERLRELMREGPVATSVSSSSA